MHPYLDVVPAQRQFHQPRHAAHLRAFNRKRACSELAYLHASKGKEQLMLLLTIDRLLTYTQNTFTSTAQSVPLPPKIYFTNNEPKPGKVVAPPTSGGRIVILFRYR